MRNYVYTEEVRKVISDKVTERFRKELLDFATKWNNGDIEFQLSEKGRNTQRLKKAVILIRGNRCEDCGWCSINPTTGNVPVQLHHIDGNHENNKPSNVKLLCPNCHSLTENYMALNKGTQKAGKRYVGASAIE